MIPKRLFAAWLMLATTSAAAHTGTGLPGGFAAGFVHPLTGWDHALAMISVGLWGAFLGRPLIYTLPILFPGIMVAGAVLGMFGVCVPAIEAGIAASVFLLGTCIALALRPPVWAAVLIVSAFAVFHGYAHGQELPSAADPSGYSAGFVLATGLLHILGIGIGLINQRPHGTTITRTAGLFIAIAGLFKAVTL